VGAIQRRAAAGVGEDHGQIHRSLRVTVGHERHDKWLVRDILILIEGQDAGGGGVIHPRQGRAGNGGASHRDAGSVTIGAQHGDDSTSTCAGRIARITGVREAQLAGHIDRTLDDEGGIRRAEYGRIHRIGQREHDRLISRFVVLMMGTWTCWTESPGLKVTVVLVGIKSTYGTAVPLVVVMKFTETGAIGRADTNDINRREARRNIFY